jgi:hypothetical protein
MKVGFLPPEPGSGLHVFENMAVNRSWDLLRLSNCMALAVHREILQDPAKFRIPVPHEKANRWKQMSAEA